MLRFIVGFLLFLSHGLYGQADGVVSGSKQVVVATNNGKIIVKKEFTKSGSVLKEYSLSVFGTFTLSSDAVLDMAKHGEKETKGRLELVLSKDCELTDIRVVSASKSSIAHQELEVFAQELLQKMKDENHHHMFQFDNELGFVNEDSCVDNIVVSIALKAV